MQVALFLREDDKSQHIGRILKSALLDAGHQINEEHPEYVIFIGGDGTFLRAVHHYIQEIHQVKFVGIHTGTLGFFCDYEPENALQVITDLEKQEISVQAYHLLEAHVHFQEHTEIVYGVNEIRLENPFHTLICDVYIDDQFLETFRGNGLNIAGVLGSSGYNKSLGGAVVESGLNALQLTEIAPISSNVFRSLGSSLVLGAERHIIFKGRFPEAIVGYDYATLTTQGPVKMEVFLSNLQVQLYHQNHHPYFKTIRETFVVDGEKKRVLR